MLALVVIDRRLFIQGGLREGPRQPSKSRLPRALGAKGPIRPTLALSPLDATLMGHLASVANKRLTAWLSPVDATLTKNRGGGGREVMVRTGHIPDRIDREHP